MNKHLLGTCAAVVLGLVATGCKTTEKTPEELEQDALYASLPYKVPENSWTVKRCPVAIECTEVKKIDENTSITNNVIKTIPFAEYTALGILGNTCSSVSKEIGFTFLKVKCDLEAIATEAENHPLQENPAFKFTQGCGDGICWGANVVRFTAIELIKGISDGLAYGFTTDLWSEREKESLYFYRKRNYLLYQSERKGWDDYCPINRTIYTDTNGKILKVEASDPYSELSLRERKNKMKDIYEKVEVDAKQKYDAWTSQGASQGASDGMNQSGDTTNGSKSKNDKQPIQPDVSSLKPTKINRAKNMAIAQVAHRQLVRVHC